MSEQIFNKVAADKELFSLESGLNKKIFVGGSLLGGKGLFASEKINKGEIIHMMIREYPKVFTSDLMKWPLDKKEIFLHFAFQGGHDYYYEDPDLFLADDSFLMNHSCDPNCWYINKKTLVANRDIWPNQELTMDYATFMTPTALERPFVCHCDSLDCRQVVKNTDCLLPEIQKKYRGHFMPHVKRYLSS